MRISDIQQKLYERLKPSGWGDKLKMFILSHEFETILTYLWDESVDGNKFTPVIKDIFRAFEECPYDDLRVVFVGQDPYPQANVADGISFSCSKTEKEQPSLRYIFDEIERTVYDPSIPQAEDEIKREDYDPDLKRWSNQGVLMLNTAMTCQIGKIGSHIDLWKPFINYLFDTLNNSNTGIVYVFLGKKSQEHAKLISKNNYKFFAVHPAAAAYKGGKWDSANLFNQINVVVEKLYGDKIIW